MTIEISPNAMTQLVGAISTKQGTQNGSTHVATVLRTDNDGTIWVHIPGGADETPVHSTTAEAQPGDTVSVTIANGRATIDGNATSPAATGRTVEVVRGVADTAQLTANDATEAAASAIEDATLARAAATSAQASAQDAETAATAATTAAGNAQVAANAATFALSDVEKVVGTLEWIAEHGEYQLTTDTAVVAGKVYYTRSGTDPNYVYTVVAEPKTADIATYYELHMDESVQNFIASHLWLDSYGLNLSVDGANGYRIHQGTVDGTKSMGMYVLDATGTAVASFGADGVSLNGGLTNTRLDDSGMEIRGGDRTWFSAVTSEILQGWESDATHVVWDQDMDGGTPWVDLGLVYEMREHVGEEVAWLFDGGGNTEFDIIGNVVTFSLPDAATWDSTIDLWTESSSSHLYAFLLSKVAGHKSQVALTPRPNDFEIDPQSYCLLLPYAGHDVGTLRVDGGVAANDISAYNSATFVAGYESTTIEGSIVTTANSDPDQIVAPCLLLETDVRMGRELSMDEGFTSFGDALLYGDLKADDVTARGDLDVTGNATVGGNLDVTGAATTHGSVFTVTDAIDIDGANPSALQYSRWFECDDKDGDRIAVFGGARETDGRGRGFFYAYNKNSAGSLVNNHMNFYVDKSGNCSYGLSDPAAFCEALHVGDRVTKDQSTAVSMATGTWTNICSVSLPAGTWVIEATGQFAANATGRRYIALSESSAAASATAQRQTGANGNAVDGGVTYLHTGATKVYTSTTTLYLVGNQNSGAALNTYGCITAVRIK